MAIIRSQSRSYRREVSVNDEASVTFEALDIGCWAGAMRCVYFCLVTQKWGSVTPNGLRAGIHEVHADRDEVGSGPVGMGPD